METLPVYKHLQELRNRFFIVVFCIVAASILGWLIKDTIVDVLLRPFEQTVLYYNTPSGGLAFLIKVSVLFGVLVSMPIVYHQIWGFIAPAFPNFHRKFIQAVTFFSTILFICGVSFSYFLLLPAALAFFNQFQEEVSLAPLISGDAYFSFVTSYLLWFGLLFQLPVVFMVLGKLGILERRHVKKFLPYSLCVSFLIAAFITPTPDPINQTMVAVPIFMLFVVSLPLVRGKRVQ